MALNPIPERKLNIGPKVQAAVDLLKNAYQAHLSHDSGHNDVDGREAHPTWIFTLPQYRNAQVAMRMNKEKVSLYLRNKRPDGSELEPLLAGLAVVEDRYENPRRGPAASLLNPNRAPYLCPGPGNRLLRIAPVDGKLQEILDLYLLRPADDTGAGTDAPPPDSINKNQPSSRRPNRPLSAEDLLNQLDRNSATGKAGEQIVLIDELERLHACGCPVPGQFVELKAETDVGCGYDIASTWPGEERCIEVKTTTSPGSDFFLTENERAVLMELGPKAWLYRVELQPDGSGKIVARIPDPLAAIPAECMRPAVWRIDARALKASDHASE